MEYCLALKNGETLNGDHPEWPLFEVTIHGSSAERIKQGY